VKLEDDAQKVLAKAMTEGAKRQLERLEKRTRSLRSIAG
jgi:TRAP-type C4-dicarboxylate transport system substrate-binding protein